LSFTDRDLRRGMDVYSADNVYLGTVIWVRLQGGAQDPQRSTSILTGQDAFSGESLGPMPTARIGNSGPRSQSPRTAYASTPMVTADCAPRRPVELLAVRMLTALNWSTLRPRVWRIPVSLVQIVSLERIVLSCSADELGA
jgi:hypothetical protein